MFHFFLRFRPQATRITVGAFEKTPNRRTFCQTSLQTLVKRPYRPLSNVPADPCQTSLHTLVKRPCRPLSNVPTDPCQTSLDQTSLHTLVQHPCRPLSNVSTDPPRANNRQRFWVVDAVRNWRGCRDPHSSWEDCSQCTDESHSTRVRCGRYDRNNCSATQNRND